MARKQQQSDQVEQPQDSETPEQQLTPKQIVQREFRAIVEQRKAQLEKLYQQRSAQLEKLEKIKEEKLSDINPKIEALEKEVDMYKKIINPINDFIDNMEIPEA